MLRSSSGRSTRCYHRVLIANSLRQILSCLKALPASTIANVLSASFDVSPLMPLSTSGQDYPGLPIVDGTVIKEPLLEALKNGVIDVPVIFQTMQAEMDTYFGNETIYNFTNEEYKNFLADNFKTGNWEDPVSSAEKVFKIYQAELNDSVELAYQTYLADVSLGCGNIELIAAMSSVNSTNNVYASVGIQGTRRARRGRENENEEQSDELYCFVALLLVCSSYYSNASSLRSLWGSAPHFYRSYS